MSWSPATRWSPCTIGSLLYRSRLVPRGLPLLGLIGVPLMLTGDVAMLFGVIGAHSLAAGLSAAPVALWELSLGLWLTFKGFRPSPILSSDPRDGSDKAAPVLVPAVV
jgi:hypothetical protein